MELYNSSIDYKSKYLKYKTKYLELKNELQDANQDVNQNGGYEDFDERKLKIFSEEKENHVTLKEPWFTYIKEGKKTVEGRLNKGLFKHLKKGDIILFKNGYDKVKVKMTGKEVYPSFEAMLNKEKLEKVLPNVNSVTEGINVYRQYYTEDMEKQNGVVAIRFNRI